MGTKKQELHAEIDQLQAENTRLAAEVRFHKARERREQRRQLQEQQNERCAAEAKERAERLQHLREGRLPLKGATQWAIVHAEGEKSGIEVFVPLSLEEQRAVRGYMENPSPVQLDEWQRSIRDSINKMTMSVQRARDYYSF